MSKKKAVIDPVLLEKLRGSGVPYTLVAGKKHVKILIDGRLVQVCPAYSAAIRNRVGRSNLNAEKAVDRAIRAYQERSAPVSSVKQYYLRGRSIDGAVWAVVASCGPERVATWSDTAQAATPVTRELGERLMAVRRARNSNCEIDETIGRLTLVDVAERPDAATRDCLCESASDCLERHRGDARYRVRCRRLGGAAPH